jgi:hypothetical protein
MYSLDYFEENKQIVVCSIFKFLVDLPNWFEALAVKMICHYYGGVHPFIGEAGL